MKVIERDPDGSPKIILATRGEMEKAGYLIAESHVFAAARRTKSGSMCVLPPPPGSWFRRDGRGVGDFFGQDEVFPTVYEKRKP